MLNKIRYGSQELKHIYFFLLKNVFKICFFVMFLFICVFSCHHHRYHLYLNYKKKESPAEIVRVHKPKIEPTE